MNFKLSGILDNEMKKKRGQDGEQDRCGICAPLLQDERYKIKVLALERKMET